MSQIWWIVETVFSLIRPPGNPGTRYVGEHRGRTEILGHHTYFPDFSVAVGVLFRGQPRFSCRADTWGNPGEFWGNRRGPLSPAGRSQTSLAGESAESLKAVASDPPGPQGRAVHQEGGQAVGDEGEDV